MLDSTFNEIIEHKNCILSPCLANPRLANPTSVETFKGAVRFNLITNAHWFNTTFHMEERVFVTLTFEHSIMSYCGDY